jgi:hypothetical protein
LKFTPRFVMKLIMLLPTRSSLVVCGALAAASGVGAEFDAALDGIAPELKKWAVLCVVTASPDGAPEFTWHEYRESGSATDFWPASTIKLYAAVAALELLNERGFPLETTAIFEHRADGEDWTLDCARTMPEMLHAVFSRSSNEDYTLLLRLVGIDRINTQFLVPERGFPHSAIMRGYVTERPCVYRPREEQRITLRASDGRTESIEHRWSGRLYAEERGCTVIDRRTGNVTSPRELAECVRRVIFHESLAESERFRLSGPQVEFLRHGGNGLSGLETKDPASGLAAWRGASDAAFSGARFYHKSGVISNYALDLAYVDDSAQSGARFILVPVIAAGSATKPVDGETLITQMSRVLCEWVRRRE